MNNNKDLSVVIPVYNEKGTLKELLKRVLKRPEVLEVIIVDDGSTDSSFTDAEALLDRKIKLVIHKRNKGKGAAIRTGIKFARGKFLIVQDADLELNPQNYSKLIKPLREGSSDFVIGNRWINNKGFFWPRLGGRILTKIINLLCGFEYKDTYCGYKIASLGTWKSWKLKSSRFEIETEIVTKAALNHLRISQVDIDYEPRTYKQGKKIKAKDVYIGIKTLLLIVMGLY